MTSITFGGDEITFGGDVITFGGSMTAPTLTTPYETLKLTRGTSGSINFGSNWSGATSFEFFGLPDWMVQSGDTGTVNYTNASWGGKNSSNSIGSGLWSINIKAIGSDPELFSTTSVYLYVRR